MDFKAVSQYVAEPWPTQAAAKRRLSITRILAVTVIVAIFLAYWNHEWSSQLLAGHGNEFPGLADIYNDTLGFQAVYAINLPERTDKRDNILVQARLTNFTVEMADGVIGSQVSRKALPHTFDQDNGTTGCWRAHTNIFAKMVQENIQSAIIFEDDADWDIGLKAQLAEFARGSRYLLDSEHRDSSGSPYGDDWDILWFGHCYSVPDPDDHRRWVIPNDPTVPPEGSRWAFAGPDMTKWEAGDNPDPQTRVVYSQIYGWCASSYAVSLRGAQRILWYASMVPYNWPIDGGMGNMCKRAEFHDFTCIAPFPRIVGRSTSAGSSNRQSDINDQPDQVVVEEKALSENVMFSVRQNAQRLLDGEPILQSYFKNPLGDSLTLEQITAFKGHPEIDEPKPEEGAQ